MQGIFIYYCTAYQLNLTFLSCAGISPIFEQLFMVFMVIFPIFMVFMVVFPLKFMVFMVFWTQLKEFLVQIELWHGQIFIKISYFVRKKCWLFRSPQARIFDYIARRRRKFWPEISVFMYFWTNLDFHGLVEVHSHFSCPWLSENPDHVLC